MVSDGTEAGSPGSDSPIADTSDLRTEVKREFLIQVVLLNLGLLALALGLLVLYFYEWIDMGSGLVIIGLVAILATYRRYRQRPPNE